MQESVLHKSYMIDVRNKFAALAIRAASSPTLSQALLTDDEVSEQPLKWLKYLIMDRVGLEPIEKIAGQVKRFRLSLSADARKWVHSQLCEAASVPHQMPLIVLKVIPWDTGAQLRNYRIHHVDEIDKVFSLITETYRGLDHELWCCQSSVSSEGFNLGGRLTLPQAGKEQVIEMVWYASPRMIESIRLHEFDLPYLRASRNAGQSSFSVVTLHIPDRYRGKEQSMWIDDFRWVAMELSTRVPSMELLGTALREIGAREVCFCFKVSDARLTVIDWDTELESTAR